MDTLKTHNYKLRFCLDKDADEKYIIKWLNIKNDCENGKNEYIVEKIKTFCLLESNRKMPYLKRCEGGMGGDDNLIHKQIRFRDENFSHEKDDDIVVDEIYSTDNERWTYEELDDLVYAFTKTFNDIIEEICVKGYIEIVNNNFLYKIEN